MFIAENPLEYTMLAVAFLCILAIQRKSPEVVDEKLFAQHRLRVGEKSNANTAFVSKLSQENFDKGVKFYKKAKIADRVFFVNNPIARAVEKLPVLFSVAFAIAASFITFFLWIIIIETFLVPIDSPVVLFPLFVCTLVFTAFLLAAISDFPTKYRILAKQHLCGYNEKSCEQETLISVDTFYEEYAAYTGDVSYKKRISYTGNLSKDLEELIFKEEDIAVISLLSSMCELESIDCSASTKRVLKKKLDARLFEHLESFDAKKREDKHVQEESNDNIAQAVVESALEADDMLKQEF